MTRHLIIVLLNLITISEDSRDSDLQPVVRKCAKRLSSSDDENETIIDINQSPDQWNTEKYLL